MTAYNDSAEQNPAAPDRNGDLPVTANPTGAAPDSPAVSNDTSGERVLTPGEYVYEPPEDRRPAGRPDAAPGRELPIKDYENLTIPEIVRRIASLSVDEMREIQEYERAHRRRKTLLVRLERQLRDA